MNRLRHIKQDKTKGIIYLHSMPGKKEDLQEFMKHINVLNVSRIFCLTHKREIEQYSPHYLDAVYYGHYDSINITYCPCPDFGIPQKEKDLIIYEKAIHEAYNTLKGSNILIHCQGGIGRTGTFAVILLRQIGFSFEDALKLTNSAGSNPGNHEQLNFAENYKIAPR
ncbi:MAG: dual specificity protein phosphatase family protein [Spirochaetaceae bacterium]|nr:dual specificity protein phosphatase family protein [Spirochaetaceae bacterium]